MLQNDENIAVNKFCTHRQCHPFELKAVKIYLKPDEFKVNVQFF